MAIGHWNRVGIGYKRSRLYNERTPIMFWHRRSVDQFNFCVHFLPLFDTPLPRESPLLRGRRYLSFSPFKRRPFCCMRRLPSFREETMPKSHRTLSHSCPIRSRGRSMAGSSASPPLPKALCGGERFGSFFFRGPSLSVHTPGLLCLI